ncbi:siroheme synthase CysG [Pseudochelatococcus sp. B33]
MHIVPRRPSEAERPRTGALDVLPVFLDLKGRRVLVSGGGEPAAWKAELLAAAGADVTVHAAEACPDMEALAARGMVRLTGRDWREADWSGLALAVGDCGEDEAAAFAATARAHGVPVNVIDRPAFCQFQFGAIVNRSPLVVGISTNGAAPILAQAVRRRIETLLPGALSGWAKLAQSVRARVCDALRPGAERRAFWERFADMSFTGAPSAPDADALIAEARNARAGRVTLVGAGPGDAEYLTLKAVRALQSADVILFDDLVSAEVLELARREARRILVGKRGKRESCRQEDINDLMVSLARRGRHVVRLKAGDPMIFGRAGEEIARLEAEGIPVSVVPGISTAFALAASLGLSLTHRDCAQSVRFVTGHSRKGDLPANLDWRALADPATTHVWYMPRRTLSAIVDNLLAHGAAPHTPAVLATSVARPDQRVWQGPLRGLTAAAGAFDIDAPTIMATGNALAAGAAAAGASRHAAVVG